MQKYLRESLNNQILMVLDFNGLVRFIVCFCRAIRKEDFQSVQLDQVGALL